MRPPAELAHGHSVSGGYIENAAPRAAIHAMASGRPMTGAKLADRAHEETRSMGRATRGKDQR